VNSATLGIDALRDMRTQRRRHRVADMEWYEALYRVYITALLGGGAILYLSDLVSDDPLKIDQLRNVHAHTPHVVGLLAALVVFLGLRSGVNGGPIAVEDAEVRHVLMAPINHRDVLRHPAIQRLRTFMFTGAIAGGVANQLLGRRIPSAGAGLPTFALWGFCCQCIVVACTCSAALVCHGIRSCASWLANWRHIRIYKYLRAIRLHWESVHVVAALVTN